MRLSDCTVLRGGMRGCARPKARPARDTVPHSVPLAVRAHHRHQRTAEGVPAPRGAASQLPGGCPASIALLDVSAGWARAHLSKCDASRGGVCFWRSIQFRLICYAFGGRSIAEITALRNGVRTVCAGRFAQPIGLCEVEPQHETRF